MYLNACKNGSEPSPFLKLFKNGPSEIFGRQPLKNLKGYGLLKHKMSSTNFTWSIREYFDLFIKISAIKF